MNIELFKKEDCTALQAAINAGKAKVKDVTSSADFGDRITIDLIDLKFSTYTNRYVSSVSLNDIQTTLSPAANKYYISNWRSKACGELQRDFKKGNLDPYVIFSFDDKLALCRKVVLDDSLEEDEFEAQKKEYDENDYFNIEYDGDFYSIIKVINNNETWNNFAGISAFNPEDYISIAAEEEELEEEPDVFIQNSEELF